MLKSLFCSGFLQWDYYVTMPMPASTFTIAVGQWQEACVNDEKTDETCVKVPRYVVHMAVKILTFQTALKLFCRFWRSQVYSSFCFGQEQVVLQLLTTLKYIK